jgi:hypothetical protein
MTIELRWCPTRKGVPGNEKADEWAKLVADEPDAHGVEFLGYGDRYRRRPFPPRSLAHLKRSITEFKWVGESEGVGDVKATHRKSGPLGIAQAARHGGPEDCATAMIRCEWM